VGRQLDGGGGGAPLMAAGYRKRGRRRWPIKDGEGERAWSVRLLPWRGRWAVAQCGVAARGGQWWHEEKGRRRPRGLGRLGDQGPRGWPAGLGGGWVGQAGTGETAGWLGPGS
jgi:hypothetical protein